MGKLDIYYTVYIDFFSIQIDYIFPWIFSLSAGTPGHTAYGILMLLRAEEYGGVNILFDLSEQVK